MEAQGPESPPPDRDWIEWDDPGPTRRFIDNHVGWVVVLIIALLSGAFFLLIMFAHNTGPALVYDPPVVHRTVTTGDGKTVDCAVSHSGMSCDWGHPQ